MQTKTKSEKKQLEAELIAYYTEMKERDEKILQEWEHVSIKL